MKIFASLLWLFGFVFIGECQKRDFYTGPTPRKGYTSHNFHITNNPCVSASNIVYPLDSEGFAPITSNETSKVERRSVGVDDRLFPEASARGIGFAWIQYVASAPKLADSSAVSAIVITDPQGRKHYLKNWVHLRIELAETPKDDWSPESIIIHMARRSNHPDFLNVAAQGQFVADFPGYTECEDVRKEIESGVAVKPTPYQFLPCPGANTADNEFANAFLYNFRAAETHGGSGAKAKTRDFKRVYHLFWKFNDNACSRMHDEYNLETFLTERYQDNPEHLTIVFATQFTVKIGNVHEGKGGGDLPSGAADPLPPTGEGWKWNCSTAFMYNDRNGKTHHDIPELTWLYEHYPTPTQTIRPGDTGSCKIDPHELDSSVETNHEDNWKVKQFSGRCNAIEGDWDADAFIGQHPNPKQLPYCFGGKHLDTFKKLNPPQYGTHFGMTFDKDGKMNVASAEICNKCPSFPTQEKINELFKEVLEKEAKEKADKEAKERAEEAEKERLRREEEEERRRQEERNKTQEEREKEKEAFQVRAKVFTVRFDDEDDGYWSHNNVKEGSKKLQQKPRSPVAMVGQSAWQFRKLHGIFEVIVAFFLTPVCVFVSRYFKETWLELRVLEQPPWLMGHLGLSLVSLIFHVFGVHSAAMGTGLMGSSLLENVKVHRHLGYVTLLLFFLLNLLGAFRPVGLCARRVCIILHWLFGLLAYALNFACVLTSIGIPGSPSAINDISFPSDSKLRTGGVEVVLVLTIVWIVLDILFHVTANALVFMSDRPEEVKRSYFPVLMPCVDEDEMIDTEGSLWWKVLLLVYTIVCALMTVTVIGVIYAQSPYGRAFNRTTLTHNGTGPHDTLYGDLLKENRMALVFPPFF